MEIIPVIIVVLAIAALVILKFLGDTVKAQADRINALEKNKTDYINLARKHLEDYEVAKTRIAELDELYVQRTEEVDEATLKLEELHEEFDKLKASLDEANKTIARKEVLYKALYEAAEGVRNSLAYVNAAQHIKEPAAPGGKRE